MRVHLPTLLLAFGMLSLSFHCQKLTATKEGSFFICKIDGILFEPTGSQFSGPTIKVKVDQVAIGRYSFSIFIRKSSTDKTEFISLTGKDIDISTNSLSIALQGSNIVSAEYGHITGGETHTYFPINAGAGELKIHTLDFNNKIIAGEFHFVASDSLTSVNINNGNFRLSF